MRSTLSLCFLLLLLTACSENNSIPDSDGDGAHDQLDQFPDDVTKAFRIAGDIKNVRGDITLILNDQQVMLSSDQEFLFDIAYGEKFTLLAESNLADELCIVSSPVHDGTVKIESIAISCITRIETALALNSITSDYLRACIEEQESSWVDEVVELDCSSPYDYIRKCFEEHEPGSYEDDIVSNCRNEILDSADGIEEFVFLKKLALSIGDGYSDDDGSKLSYIDLTKNVLLEELDVVAADIDISGLDGLTKLTLAGFEGSSIDLTEFVNLNTLLIFGVDLEEIKLSKLVELEYLGILSSELKSIDLSELSKLIFFMGLDIKIESLDISNNINLEWLHMSSAQFKTLSTINNKKLTNLSLWGNEIEFIDVSNNKNLTSLNLNYNKLKSVPVGIRAIKDKSAEINLEDNPFTENAKAELMQLKQEYENLIFDE